MAKLFITTKKPLSLHYQKRHKNIYYRIVSASLPTIIISVLIISEPIISLFGH